MLRWSPGLFSFGDFVTENNNQQGQMNDASEVLGVIFDCLHQSFVQPSSVSDNESVESNAIGTWGCKDSKACLVHSVFGMDIFERMNCYSCGLESRHLKYASFFHNINASALRTAKVLFSKCVVDIHAWNNMFSSCISSSGSPNLSPPNISWCLPKAPSTIFWILLRGTIS